MKKVVFSVLEFFIRFCKPESTHTTLLMLLYMQLCLCTLLQSIRSCCTIHVNQVRGVEMCRRICQQIECCGESYDEKQLKCVPNPSVVEAGPAESATCTVLTRRVQTRTNGEQAVKDCVIGYTGDFGKKATSNSSLFEVYLKGGDCLVRFILTRQRHTVDLEQRDEDGLTVLMLAAYDGNKEMFEMFASEGASLSVKTRTSKTLLMLALHTGNLDIVKYILNNSDVDINSVDQFGCTALMYVCGLDDISIFQLILARGGSINSTDNDGHGILYRACFFNDTKIVKYILTHYNADNYQSISNDLDESLRFNIASGYLEKVRLLMEHGADLTFVDSENNNMLIIACQSKSSEMIEYVLSKNCVPVDTRGHGGATAFLVAAYRGTVEIMEILIKSGCNTSATDYQGYNVLHYVCMFGILDHLEFVLKKGFIKDINSRTVNRLTALHFSTDFDHTDLFDLLVSSGADVAAVDEEGGNVLHWACRHGHINMVRHILQLSQGNVHNVHPPSVNSRDERGITPMFEAVTSGSMNIVDLLVSYGGYTNATDEDGDTILHNAVREGRIGVAQYIITKQYVSVESRGAHGYTSILTAAYHGQIEIFKYLMSIHCDKEATDDYNGNIFHVACCGGHVKMVKYIYKKGYISKPGERGWMGRTPVLLAAHYGHMEVVQCLLELRFDMNAVDDEGNNALHLALLENHGKLAMYLIESNIVDKNLRNKDGITALVIAESNGLYKIVNMLYR